MLRTTATLAALCFVASFAAPVEIDDDTKALFASLKTLDKSFLAEAKELFKNGGDKTRAQLIAELDEKIAALPAEQQVVANSLKAALLSKVDVVKQKKKGSVLQLQKKIATLSSGAQEVANKALALLSDASLTRNQLLAQVKALIADAPEDVKKEIEAVRAELVGKIQAVAGNFNLPQ